MGSTKTIPPPSPPLLRPLVTLDAAVSYSLHTLFKPILPTFLLLLLEYSADFRFSFPVSLSLFLAFPSLSSLFLPLILGLLLDLALIGLIKLTFRRPRPHYNPNMSPAVHADNFSFPSGHASRVLFLATLFHLLLQNDDAGLVSGFIQRWVGFEPGLIGSGIWVWAVLTASSRVLLGRHYLSDVLAGAVVGVVEGIVAFRFFRFEVAFPKLLHAHRHTKVTLGPEEVVNFLFQRTWFRTPIVLQKILISWAINWANANANGGQL